MIKKEQPNYYAIIPASVRIVKQANIIKFFVLYKFRHTKSA